MVSHLLALVERLELLAVLDCVHHSVGALIGRRVEVVAEQLEHYFLPLWERQRHKHVDPVGLLHGCGGAFPFLLVAVRLRGPFGAT